MIQLKVGICCNIVGIFSDDFSENLRYIVYLATDRSIDHFPFTTTFDIALLVASNDNIYQILMVYMFTDDRITNNQKN